MSQRKKRPLARQRPLARHDGWLSLLAPKQKGGYYRLLGRAPNGTLIDTTAGRNGEEAKTRAAQVAAAYRGEGGRLADRQFERLIAEYLNPLNHSKWGPRRAHDVGALHHNDFNPAALRADLAGNHVAARRLYSAAEMIDHAADLLSEFAGLVHDNERRWRVFRSRVQQIVAALEPAAIAPDLPGT